MNLSYYPRETNLIHRLAPLFEERGYSIKPFSNADLGKIDLFLLFQPIKQNGSFVCCEELWYKYLKVHTVDVSFMVAGFSEGTDKDWHFIDLLDLTQARHRIETLDATMVKETRKPEHALDMAQLMQRFLDGHGGESVMRVFNKITMILSIFDREITLDGANYTSLRQELILGHDLLEKWYLFKYRWSYYAPYFGCLPFADKLEEVDRMMKAVEPFFEEEGNSINTFKELSVLDKLQNLKLNLKEVREYVF
ncbi:MAG: hypothetical protein HRU41_19145 [Saprospiraceae bacterium]|nr:hypothetical protein [Saprospiraceae bacterium]